MSAGGGWGAKRRGRVAPMRPDAERKRRRLVALAAWSMVLGALGGCGPGPAAALLPVAQALSRTEAARTARFELVWSSPGLLKVEVGAVNFTRDELSFTLYQGQPSPNSWASEGLVVGDKQYDRFARTSPVPLWGTATTDYPLGALAFPLMAISSHDKVVDLGYRRLDGSVTTEYRLEAPAATADYGTHVAARSVYLWLDGNGRIRQLTYSETETRPGSAAAGPRFVTATYAETLRFSHFGTPVEVAPPTTAKPR